VAALLAALLDQGTATRSAEQIQQTIDSIGGAIGAGSGTELTFVNAVVMKDSFDLALDLVSDVARNASFAPGEVELQRKQMLSGLTVSYEDPEYLAGVVFDRLVFGFHPYGRPDGGTPESIAAITREDLQAFHKAWFGANNAVLAIVGDVQPDQAFAGAERAFGAWGQSTSTAEKPVDPPAPTRRLVIVDRPGAVQTEIRAGHTAVPRKHPDYLALDLAMKILGGEGGNRLHRVLRSERGLTYGASADLNALKNSGNIVAETDTRSDSTPEALRLLVDELWRLQRQRVSERELADAQAYLTGSFPLTIETPSAIALQVLNAVFYGLDLEELQTFRERVNAITVDDIQRVARAYLHPDRLSIVLVGDAGQFQKQLAGAGFDQVERISVGDLDLTAVDLRRKTAGGSRPPAAAQTGEPQPATVDAAGAWVARRDGAGPRWAK
jgi:zinc protease